ncbi:MAG: hypothetical protein JNL67_02650 [Planctomycetaceae bacterium]|nr:hypothetical protein [Planctomycetaceae bacterium]
MSPRRPIQNILVTCCRASALCVVNAGTWVSALLFIGQSCVIAQDDGPVSVLVVVSAPEFAKETAPQLYLAGSLPALGNWAPDGLLLERQADNTYHAAFAALPGTTIQFKVTCGSWQTVERDARGRDIPNRQIDVKPQPAGQVQRVEIIVGSWAQGDELLQSTVVGRLIKHEFRSKTLGNSRTIAVWLPSTYDTRQERYPVLYMHDGQNLFDKATAAFGQEWQVDEAVTTLIDAGEIPPMVIVGIWNTADRIDEYTMTVDARMNAGGAGRLYLEFVVDELKPWIDNEYRTDPSRDTTWIGGSSLGALISLHACIERPEVFAGCLAFSPSLGWDREQLLTAIAEKQKSWPLQSRLWLSMGTHEGGNPESHAANTRRAAQMAEVLIEQGLEPDVSLWHRSFENDRHDEVSWAKQFPAALRAIK